jgi:hypothetical protein
MSDSLEARWYSDAIVQFTALVASQQSMSNRV